MKNLIICNKNFDKKKIRNLIEWFLNNYGNIKTCKILDSFKKIGFKYSKKSGISIGLEDLQIPEIKEKLIYNTEILMQKTRLNLFKGKINKIQNTQQNINIWNITNESLKKEVVKNFKHKDINNPVYIMIVSGARGNISQIKQLVGMRGLMADSKGETINTPIKSNFKEGLNSEEYFISCYGARKGIIDTALKTANSGYLTRKLIFVAQNIIIKQPDCKSSIGTLIKINIKNKTKYLKNKEKIIGRILNENIINFITKKKIISKGQDICNYLAKKLMKLRKYIIIRTTLDCKLNSGICQLCYGWNLSTHKIVKLGESVGILAAQSIGEPGTQLTMRTFHTGGIFTNKIKKVIQSNNYGNLNYSKFNLKKIKTKYGENGLIVTKNKKFILNSNYFKKFIIKIPKNSILFIKKNEKVFKKQIIAEIPKWEKENKKENKNTIENIKTESSGQILIKKKTINLINGHISFSNKIYSKIQFYQNKKKFFKFNTKITKIKNSNKLKKINKSKNNLVLNFQEILNTKKNLRKKIKGKNSLHQIKKIKYNKILLQKIINKKISPMKKTNKIGNFVKINFENINKPGGQIIEIRQKISIIKTNIKYLLNKYSKIKIKNNTLVSKNSSLYNIMYNKQKTNDIVEGLPKVETILEARKNKSSKETESKLQIKLKNYLNKFKILYTVEKSKIKAMKKIQNEIINLVQKVYNSQDVSISRKNIEIIVKQMISKGIIKYNGDSTFIAGEIIDIKKIQQINKILKNKIEYEPIILGISQISLLSESFISAACFQETTRILTKAAILGKIDWLKGLKENIILGNLIPTGTAFNCENT